MKNYKLKNHEEMLACILEARDEYVRKKQYQKKLIKQYTPLVLSFCFTMLIGVSVWKDIRKLPEIPAVSEKTTTETTTKVIESETNPSASESSTTKKELQTDKAIASTIEHQTESSEVSTTISETGISETGITDPIETPIPEISYPVTTALTEELQNPETSIGTVTEILPSTTKAPTETIVSTIATAEESSVESHTEKPETTVTSTDQLTEDPSTSETSTDLPDEETPSNTTANSQPWEELPIYQQYTIAEIGSPAVFYRTADIEISSTGIGDYLGTAYMDGYDEQNDAYYHCYAEVYAIRWHPEQDIVAVQFENRTDFFAYIRLT